MKPKFIVDSEAIAWRHDSLYCVDLLVRAASVRSQRIKKRLGIAYFREHKRRCGSRIKFNSVPW